jgi:osmoprotectant transport system permease protein
MIAGAFLIAALALLTELLLVLVSWAVTPGPRRLPFLTTRSRNVATPEPTASGVPL